MWNVKINVEQNSELSKENHVIVGFCVVLHTAENDVFGISLSLSLSYFLSRALTRLLPMLRFEKP